MKLIRKVSLVAATFFLAAATGQYMQQTAQKRPAIGPDEPSMTYGIFATTRTGALRMPARPATRSALSLIRNHGDRVPALAHHAPVLAAPRTSEEPYPRLARACGPHLALRPMAGALLGLRLTAPCHPGQRVVIRHAGLAFTARTTVGGIVLAKLPALTRDAAVSITFPGGQTVAATARVPDAALYRRVAVQWVANDRFTLQGLEDAARPGGRHGLAARARGLRDPRAGGYLMQLGDAQVRQPMLAQVYTYPVDGAGRIRLALEAAVTHATCGRDMLGQTVRTRQGARPLVTDLSVHMPGCGQVGGYLELGSLVRPHRIARA